jgi:hypothetical protein
VLSVSVDEFVCFKTMLDDIYQEIMLKIIDQLFVCPRFIQSSDEQEG